MKFRLFFFSLLLLIPAILPAQDSQEIDTVEELKQRISVLETELQQLKQTLLNDRLINRLDGVWWQQSCVRSGSVVTPVDEVIWKLSPDEAYQWLLSPEPPMWKLGTMEIDATQNPVWVTFKIRINTTHEQAVYALPAILKIERDNLYLALNEDARCTPNANNEHQERPKRFESTKENGVSLFTLKRRRDAR